MGDKFKTPTMDWSTPGDLRRRFQTFKQKCQLIFEGPLADKDEAYKVRMLLLWSDDKGLEIYNTATWTREGDNLRLEPVFGKLEAYVMPRSNQILARFQLRCLKQGEMPLEEFITRARTLVDDSGYPAATREETLRDTLVFGLKSDKVRRDAIAIGNNLTYQQVYDLAKTEESTKAQMDVISKGAQTPEVHAVRSRRAPQHKNQSANARQEKKKYHPQQNSKGSRPSKPCYNCGEHHTKEEKCPAKNAKCHFCKKKGHYQKVCRSKSRKVNDLSHNESSEDLQSYMMGDIGLITTTVKSVNNVSTKKSSDDKRHIDKIYARVKLNDKYSAKLKVDTGSDTCTLTTDDLKKSKLPVKIMPSNCILNNYGGGRIKHYGSTNLKITFLDRSTIADFKVVKAPGNPSILGCRQALELGLLKLNVSSIDSKNAMTSFNLREVTKSGALTKDHVLKLYGDCFDKIGKFPGKKYKIRLTEDAKPVIHPPRTVPVHIMPLYKAEIDKMLADGIISPVTQPTDWVNSIVCNVKETSNGKKVRLCLDPKDLNKYIRREHYYNRTIDEILPRLHNKTYFSVIDTKKGYWHVELDAESSLLCTFNSPFGRFKFNRLPFGVKVAQDAFQQRLDHSYHGIDNVCGIADDIIVAGATLQEHDEAMVKMLEASRRNNISLNSEKLQFKKTEVKFYGHKLTANGIQPSEDKLQSIRNLKTPESRDDVLTTLGIINYLNRFSTKLAVLTAPLRELVKTGVHFRWDERHEAALNAIKRELCGAKILSYYDSDPNKTTILQCDASQQGLGAWLRQVDDDGTEQIVAMCSRSLTDTERNYSNIERECLAVKFGLQKFEYYLMGRHTIVESDHSPLQQIFKKNIAEASPRIQKMILWCLRFDITVIYKPGRKIPVADALSRVCLPKKQPDQTRNHEVSFVSGITSPIDIARIKDASLQDSTLNMLKNAVFKGWPNMRKQCPQELWDYWNFRCDLVIDDGLVLKGNRIVMPKSLQKEVLEAIHTGHQGETKCLLLARESVFWPGITNDIREMIQKCDACSRHQAAPSKLPILQPDLPTKPWEKIGTDIFEYEGKKYLMAVDYYSRYFIVRLLPDIRAQTVCSQFTNIFTEFGMPKTIMADFGSQYTSEEFKRRCKEMNISITYSSPYHHQTNSVAERAIGTVKHLWKKSKENKATALWMYRITPLDDHLPSPYEMLFNRKPRSFLPTTEGRHRSRHPRVDHHLQHNEKRQKDQARFYNAKASHDRAPLKPGEAVDVYNTIIKEWEPATVMRQDHLADQPRTYIVQKGSKQYQRTRQHLKPRKGQPPAFQPDESAPVISNYAATSTTEANQRGSIPDTPKVQPQHQPKLPRTTCSSQQQQTSPETIKMHTTRSGRTTKVPISYKD